METTPRDSEVRAELLDQHEALRHLLTACDGAAERILAAHDTGGGHLLACLVQLLGEFQDHNEEEEVRLRPLLLAADSFGEVRVDRMVEDHLAEHAALRQALREAADMEVPDRAALATLELVSRLRSHLDAEERQFLNDRVLRDDLVAVDSFIG